MSDYGLLSRKLTLGIKYEDSPYTYADAKVPVFAVGREQLCEMFGLYGNNKSKPTNFVCELEALEDCIQDCNYALVCFGHWADGTPSRMVTLCNAYETLEQCYYSVGCAIELDSWHLIKHPLGVTYEYEVWQICDDYNLYAAWDRESERYICDSGQKYKFSQVWRLSYEDNADYEAEFGSRIMSEDYLSSLKTANASRINAKRETCYFCGCFLPGKDYSVRVGDEMKLVCRACFSLHQKHDHDGLRYRTIGTFICHCCGRTMKEKYYVDTSIGVYCSECKAENPDLGEVR